MSGDHVHKQHIVSQVLLRQWAIDGYIQVSNLDRGNHYIRSPKAEGFDKDYIRHNSVSAERVWGDIEAKVPAALAAVREKTVFAGLNQEKVLMGLLALHLVRSFRVKQMWDMHVNREIDVALNGFLSEQVTQNSADFHVEIYRQNQLQEGITERIDGVIDLDSLREKSYDCLASGGPRFSKEVVRVLGLLNERLSGYHLEVAISQSDLIIGDNPVVLMDHEAGIQDVINGVTVDSSDALFMPVTPKHIIALSKTSRYRHLSKRDTEYVNSLQLNQAIRKVYMIPDSRNVKAAREEYDRRISIATNG